MAAPWKAVWLHLPVVAALAAVAVVDAFTPTGLLVAMFYLVPVAYAAALPYRFSLPAVGATAIALALLDLVTSDARVMAVWVAVFNRVLMCLVIAAVAGLLTWLRRAER